MAVSVAQAGPDARFIGTAVLYLIWGAIASAVVLPAIFRRNRWLRLIGVLIMLAAAELAWMGIQTCARIATEKGHVAAEGPAHPFVQGALAARDAALQMSSVFWAVVLGLAVLAIVPLGPKE